MNIIKKGIFCLLIFTLSLQASGQSGYEIIKDADSKIIKGIISRSDLMKDSSFPWLLTNQKGYTSTAKVVEAFKSKGQQVEIIAFGGTWCDDTKIIFPKFFSLIDAAGLPKDQVTIIGVDRNKKTSGHLSEAFGVINVPTFILMKNGKELGRVVEYGKTGQWDEELAQILNGSK